MFCKNKDKPGLKYNGKCKISKLAEQESDNDKNSYNIKKMKEKILLLTPNLILKPVRCSS